MDSHSPGSVTWASARAYTVRNGRRGAFIQRWRRRTAVFSPPGGPLIRRRRVPGGGEFAVGVAEYFRLGLHGVDVIVVYGDFVVEGVEDERGIRLAVALPPGSLPAAALRLGAEQRLVHVTRLKVRLAGSQTAGRVCVRMRSRRLLLLLLLFGGGCHQTRPGYRSGRRGPGPVTGTSGSVITGTSGSLVVREVEMKRSGGTGTGSLAPRRLEVRLGGFRAEEEFVYVARSVRKLDGPPSGGVRVVPGLGGAFRSRGSGSSRVRAVPAGSGRWRPRRRPLRVTSGLLGVETTRRFSAHAAALAMDTTMVAGRAVVRAASSVDARVPGLSPVGPGAPTPRTAE